MVSNKNLQQRRNRGFTLIEIMITIAIVGILFTVAVPSYKQSQRKTRRTDGIAAALQIQVAQEKFRGSCAFYAQSLGSTNSCGTTAALSTVKASSTTDGGYYTMSILANSASGNAYTIVATAAGDQASDTGCTTLSLAFSSTNPKGAKSPAACWPK